MNDRYEECELGADVTHLFKSKERQAGVSISVGLEAEELAWLEGIGRESGKTVAQVIREAIAVYRGVAEAAPGQR